MRNRFIAAIAVAVMGASSPLLAKVTQAEAARLNNELTPVGAERAGNAAGFADLFVVVADVCGSGLAFSGAPTTVELDLVRGAPGRRP